MSENDTEPQASPGAWLYRSNHLAWTSDPKIRSQLPFLYRLFALYCHVIRSITSNYVRGGEKAFQLFRWVTRMLSFEYTSRLKLGDRVVFVNLLDPRFSQVINEVQGSDTDIQVLDNLLSKGDTFVDVGANHGSFAITASHLVGPDGYVVAVEPQPRLSTLIRQSLKEGRSPFEVHQAALGDTVGEVPLFVPKDTSGSAGIHESYSATHDHRKVTVPLRTFDQLVDWEKYPGRLVVKLDVEGSEVSFLKGAKEMIKERHPILILEINPKTLEASGNSGKELRNTLLEYEYDFFHSQDDLESKHPLSKLPTSKQRNVIIS